MPAALGRILNYAIAVHTESRKLASGIQTDKTEALVTLTVHIIWKRSSLTANTIFYSAIQLLVYKCFPSSC